MEQVTACLGAGVAPVTAAASPSPPLDNRLAEASLSGMRVLLAEDNPVNALLARTVMTRAGATVTVASDGEEAVAACAEGKHFDLILLDLRMPRLDGLGAARRIRALQGPMAKAPIVALTADAAPEDRTAAREAGMDDFVTKPISPDQLEALAARFFLKAGSKPAPAA